MKGGKRGNCGLWREMDREIRINHNLPLHQQWITLFHELMHAGLTDAGVDELLRDKPKLLEAICDANATARMREMFTTPEPAETGSTGE